MLNPESTVITFGVDTPSKCNWHTKPCWCGREINIEETITGSGMYSCECGINRPIPDYLAKEIDETNGNYTLQTPDGDVEVNMQLLGLHNVYNSIGAIAAAREFFQYTS